MCITNKVLEIGIKEMKKLKKYLCQEGTYIFLIESKNRKEAEEHALSYNAVVISLYSKELMDLLNKLNNSNIIL